MCCLRVEMVVRRHARGSRRPNVHEESDGCLGDLIEHLPIIALVVDLARSDFHQPATDFNAVANQNQRQDAGVKPCFDPAKISARSIWLDDLIGTKLNAGRRIPEFVVVCSALEKLDRFLFELSGLVVGQ